MTLAVLTGDRVRLRPWRESDLAPFAALNADLEVMRHLVAPLSRAESDAYAARNADHIARHGFGFWAVEVDALAFAGCVGLRQIAFEAAFTPAVEIAWRLARPAWGRGYATEAARLALDHGFDVVGLDEIVAFTVAANERSWRVMERLGMSREGPFDHPNLPQGHALRPHLLYRSRARHS